MTETYGTREMAIKVHVDQKWILTYTKRRAEKHSERYITNISFYRSFVSDIGQEPQPSLKKGKVKKGRLVQFDGGLAQISSFKP